MYYLQHKDGRFRKTNHRALIGQYSKGKTSLCSVEGCSCVLMAVVGDKAVFSSHCLPTRPQMLDENAQLIQAIVEKQNKGRAFDAMQ